MSRNLTRRQFLQGAAGLAGAAVLSGCGATGPTPTAIGPTAPPAGPRPVGLLRFAWWTDVGPPTPFQISTTGPGGAVLLSLIFDTLTWKNAQGIIPWLASSWEAAPDGTSYTFHLVEGVHWQDGQPLTADDVKFSFDYYAHHLYRWMPTPMVAAAEVLGPQQVRVRLTRPYAAFLEDIAGTVPLIPRHVWEAVADPAKYQGADATIGSGPFRFVSHDEAAGAYRLVADPVCWRGRPTVAEWRQFTVPPESRVEIVRQGGADVSLSSDASVRDLLAGDPRLRVFETAPLSIVRLVVNPTRPPLDRKEVRQAILYALDRQRIAETVTRGPAIVGSAGVVPPETPWYNPTLKQYPYDPARARALLGGQPLILTLLADASAREPDLLRPMLAAVGITLNVQTVDAATRAQLLTEGTFQLALTTHIGVGGDPDYLRRWYAGEEMNTFAQGSIFHNATYAALGAQQAATLDPTQRRALVFRMQEILAEELPTIVLYHRRFYWVYDPAVFTPAPTAGGLMNGIPFPDNKLTLFGA
ncbi:MAG TPA: ABC transporter substrate-binding protein [Chloroflexia bacterium]|nr:ABC transporter substrate-binding protein [Chloroflexia bacterium]